MSAGHRSVLPNVPGVPWWGAVLVAVTASAAGFAFDAGSGDKQLTMVFGVLYAIGCIAAVLVVRQSSIFTAVVQPPLILFASVPGAYFLFSGATFTGVKDLLIDCGYPLIERFLLMLFTSTAVLLVGLVRWYLGMAARSAVNTAAATESTDQSAPGGLGGFGESIGAKLASLWGHPHDDEDTEDGVDNREEIRARRHSTDRSTRAAPSRGARTGRSGRPTKRAEPVSSRQARPPLPDSSEAPPERPRRPRPPRQSDPSPEPRRRARNPAPREPRDPGVREPLPPYDSNREFDRRPRYDRRERERAERPEQRDRQSRYETYEPPQRPKPSTNGSNGTHHPVSRVRYRGGDDEGDTHVEYRRRPTSHRSPDTETWE